MLLGPIGDWLTSTDFTTQPSHVVLQSPSFRHLTMKSYYPGCKMSSVSSRWIWWWSGDWILESRGQPEFLLVAHTAPGSPTCFWGIFQLVSLNQAFVCWYFFFQSLEIYICPVNHRADRHSKQKSRVSRVHFWQKLFMMESSKSVNVQLIISMHIIRPSEEQNSVKRTEFSHFGFSKTTLISSSIVFAINAPTSEKPTTLFFSLFFFFFKKYGHMNGMKIKPH